MVWGQSQALSGSGSVGTGGEKQQFQGSFHVPALAPGRQSAMIVGISSFMFHKTMFVQLVPQWGCCRMGKTSYILIQN